MGLVIMEKKKNKEKTNTPNRYKIIQTNNLTLPLKMTSEMVESAWANIGFFLHHFDLEIRIIVRFVRLHLKIIKKEAIRGI